MRPVVYDEPDNIECVRSHGVKKNDNEGPPGFINKDGRLVSTSHEKGLKGSFSICPFAILALFAFPLESVVELILLRIAKWGEG